MTLTLEECRKFRESEFIDTLAGTASYTYVTFQPRATVAAPARKSHQWTGTADLLRTIPATDYVPALTGQELGRDGKTHCPLHEEDRTPSLQAYPEDRGWYCFGCGRGGNIYDLGAHLWNIGTRGDEFRELRRRLARELLRTAA